jgi:hypothetical protein
MIVELPLITAEEIAAEYRPGSHVTVKATMRRLREKKLVSPGVSEHPKGPGGKVAGSIHLYSALNLDAARAVRSDDLVAARRIAKVAARVERGSRTMKVAQTLAMAGGITTFCQSTVNLDGVVRTALLHLARETSAERNRLFHGHSAEAPRLGRVVRMHGGLAYLALQDGGTPVSLPRANLDVFGCGVIGAAVALQFEALGHGQTLIKALPAISLEEGSEEPIYPYERPLPEHASAIALLNELSSPTIRRPRRIPIAGRR